MLVRPHGSTRRRCRAGRPPADGARQSIVAPALDVWMHALVPSRSPPHAARAAAYAAHPPLAWLRTHRECRQISVGGEIIRRSDLYAGTRTRMHRGKNNTQQLVTAHTRKSEARALFTQIHSFGRARAGGSENVRPAVRSAVGAAQRPTEIVAGSRSTVSRCGETQPRKSVWACRSAPPTDRPRFWSPTCGAAPPAVCSARQIAF